jgi:hypothetical protein
MGRHKHIKTPEIMWDLFDEYRKWAKDNPIKKQDFVGKDAIEVDRELSRALTMDGFENYLADKGVISDASDYFENKGEAYTDYKRVCARIKRVIRQDQIEGGMAGIYNPNITQRLNNLVEKVQEDGTKQLIIKVIDGDTASPDHTG